MANPEHVAILEQGVGTWNGWRRNRSLEIRTLSDLSLEGWELTDEENSKLFVTFHRNVDLSGANFTMQDLSGAHLYGVNLDGADLTGAKLNGADLFGTSLRGTVLSGVHLYGANLFDADLSEAHLEGTNFSGLALTGVNMAGAHLNGTVFGNTDLRSTRGLDSCKHFGRSTIDLRTIALSGDLPLTFLRGCGLSDWEIEIARLHRTDLASEHVIEIVYRVAQVRGGHSTAPPQLASTDPS